MAETGCLKDGCFQNLQVEGNMTALTDLEVTGTFQQGRNRISLTDTTELQLDTHGVTASGGTYVSVTGDGKTITLPAIDSNVGAAFIIVNDNADGTGLLTISPNGADRFLINIAGTAGGDNKDIINTKATQKKGDYVKLVALNTVGWSITELKGTWVDEA